MNTSVLEIPHLREPTSNAASPEPHPTASAPPNVGFSPEEIRLLQRDDAMASVVVAFILSLAFLVLFCLAVGANVWTTFFAR